MRKKFCVITSSRADYNYLFLLMKEFQKSKDSQLQVIATGTHLSETHGKTVCEILKDGFNLDAEVFLPLEDDSFVGLSKAVSLTVEGISAALENLKPDWVIILGDRYEIFASALAATLHNIPIAHLGGGDTTIGAIDEVFRHGITKMSHLHFVSNFEAGRRVRQLGENPSHVFVVGSTTIDNLMRIEQLSRESFFEEIGMIPSKKNFLITYHPETLGDTKPEVQMKQLLDSLDSIGSGFGIIFTRPNADQGNKEINRMLDSYVSTRPWTKIYSSLGQRLYVNALRHCDVVIGNSSSGIYEAPSFKKPTVNIGDRQKGRLKADSVIDVGCNVSEITAGIRKALNLNCSLVENIYGDGKSSSRIFEKMMSINEPKSLLKKHFYDWKESI